MRVITAQESKIRTTERTIKTGGTVIRHVSGFTASAAKKTGNAVKNFDVQFNGMHDEDDGNNNASEEKMPELQNVMAEESRALYSTLSRRQKKRFNRMYQKELSKKQWSSNIIKRNRNLRGHKTEKQINQIIAKLQRKKRNMSPKMMDYFISMTDGKDPSQLIMEIEKSDVQEAKNRLLKYRDVFKMLQETKANGSRPVVVSDAEDVLTEHSRGYGNAEKPEDYLNAFSRYIQSNRNEIAALNIICTRPKDLTRKDLKDLRLTLDREGFTTQQLNTALYELTNEEIMADIISLIRRYAIGSTLISHEARIHRAVEKLRKKHNFSKQEQSWISRIEKYLLGESVMNIKVFDEDSRFASYGGFKKINKVFQNNLESIVLELNEYLYDDGGNVA